MVRSYVGLSSYPYKLNLYESTAYGWHSVRHTYPNHIFVSVPSQSTDFQRHMSVVFLVFNCFRCEMTVRFVYIGRTVDHLMNANSYLSLFTYEHDNVATYNSLSVNASTYKVDIRCPSV